MTASTPSVRSERRTAQPLPGPVIQIAALVVGIAASAVDGYIKIFSRFAPHDDEGYIMLTVKQFLEGMPLYDQIYSQYGPFYYLWKLALFKLLGTPVTHDVTRLTTLALWIAFASLCAVFIYRQTKSLNWTLICYLQCFFHAAGLTQDPGHPQELIILLLSAIIVTATLLPARAPGLALIGILAAFILFTKINVGVYVAVSVGIALLALCPRRPAIVALAVLSSVAALSLPLAVMSRHLLDWGGTYAAVVSLTAAASCFAAFRSPVAERLRPGKLLWAAGGFAAAGGIVVILTLLSGSSRAGLLDGVLLRPLRFSGVFQVSLHLSAASIGVALFSLAAAICCFYLLTKSTVSRKTLDEVFIIAKVVVGVIGMYFETYPGFELLTCAVPFLWVVLLPPPGKTWRIEELFPRLILCLVAALQSMTAYPVAASQVAWSTILVFPVLFLCLSDAFNAMAPRAMPAIRDVAPVALLAIAASLYYPELRSGSDLSGFRSLTPLGLPGAEKVRLPADEAALYQSLTSNLGTHCSAFVSLPGYHSLHFWTGVEPVTGFNTTVWPLLLTRAEQQRIVDRLREHPRACAIYGMPGAPGWLTNPPRGRGEPLVKYLRDSFRPVEWRAGYAFMIRRERAWP